MNWHRVIGGPHDGSRVSVPSGTDVIELCVTPNEFGGYSFAGPRFRNGESVTRARYLLLPCADMTVAFVFDKTIEAFTESPKS